MPSIDSYTVGDVYKRQGKLNEADIKAAMREVRMALLEADVNYKVAKDFCAQVSERAMGQEAVSYTHLGHEGRAEGELFVIFHKAHILAALPLGQLGQRVALAPGVVQIGAALAGCLLYTSLRSSVPRSRPQSTAAWRRRVSRFSGAFS